MKIIKSHFFSVIILLLLFSCAPKEPVVFKGVKNITIDLSSNGKPELKGEALFYNPNKLKMKLKSVDIDITVDGNKSAEVKHPLNVIVPSQGDFSVPLTAQLTLKEGGILNTVFGLLGGKKYEVVFSGDIHMGVHGITIKVPVMQKQEIKL